uniref:Uncharacterized protein n=1 Tax=Lepeophtheirus salmonis TaxID=72036 RepID=A0A0K2U9B1_LEPSM
MGGYKFYLVSKVGQISYLFV